MPPTLSFIDSHSVRNSCTSSRSWLMTFCCAVCSSASVICSWSASGPRSRPSRPRASTCCRSKLKVNIPPASQCLGPRSRSSRSCTSTCRSRKLKTNTPSASRCRSQVQGHQDLILPPAGVENCGQGQITNRACHLLILAASARWLRVLHYNIPLIIIIMCHP